MEAIAQQNDRQIFEAIAQKISKITGVQLGEKQYSLVLSRLSKHLRNMGGLSPSEYWEYLQANEEDEVPVLISLLTTHHTFFFREQIHFDYLEQELPNLIHRLKDEGRDTLRIWCAACSKGQEGYTLAMFLDYHMKQLRSDIKFEILFSDVDQASVNWAQNGVYSNDELARVPITYRSNHWIRGKGSISDFSKVRQSLKEKCKFKVINLLELTRENFNNKFDIVFCRNVFIYFSVMEIESISKNILKNMVDNGLFIIGVSESLLGARLAVEHIGKSIYLKSHEEHLINVRKSIHESAPIKKKIKNKKRITIAPQVHSEPLGRPIKKETIESDTSVLKEARVMTLQSSVKLSPDIRTFLSKLPNCRSVGFDVITSSQEAIAKIHQKDANLLILDMGANRYIKKIIAETGIKILIAALPDDNEKEIARALELGAIDFVKLTSKKLVPADEKTLEKKITLLRSEGFVKQSSYESPSLKPSIDIDQDYVIGIGASTGGTEAITKILTELPHETPPIVIVQHIPEFYSKQFADRLDKLCEFDVKEAENGDVLRPGLALVAPGNYQMRVALRGGVYKVKVYEDEKVNGHRPSVDVLFDSLAEVVPEKLLGVILTGMGSDGAAGLLKMKESGAHTISQDKASSIVYGMPKVAFEMGASEKSVALEEIAPYLINYVSKK